VACFVVLALGEIVFVTVSVGELLALIAIGACTVAGSGVGPPLLCGLLNGKGGGAGIVAFANCRSAEDKPGGGGGTEKDTPLEAFF